MGMGILNKPWFSVPDPVCILHKVSSFLDALNGTFCGHFRYIFLLSLPFDLSIGPHTVFKRSDIHFLNRLIFEHRKPTGIILASYDPVYFITKGLTELEAFFFFYQLQLFQIPPET